MIIYGWRWVFWFFSCTPWLQSLVFVLLRSLSAVISYIKTKQNFRSLYADVVQMLCVLTVLSVLSYFDVFCLFVYVCAFVCIRVCCGCRYTSGDKGTISSVTPLALSIFWVRVSCWLGNLPHLPNKLVPEVSESCLLCLSSCCRVPPHLAFHMGSGDTN